MVSWQEWVAVVFEVVEEAGVEVTGDVFGQTTQAASVVWNEDKVEIKAMSKTEARAKASADITIET